MKKTPFVVAICVSLVVIPRLGRGQHLSAEMSACIQSCHDSCYNRYVGCYDLCFKQYCESLEAKPAPFGSIAFGLQGAEGMSWNQATQALADQMALSSCNAHGKDCRIVYRFQNTCAALAVTTDQRHSEAATGDTEKKAEANAIALCQQHWGNCKSNLSDCSLTGAAKPAAPPPPKAISWGAMAYSIPDMGAGWSMGKADRGTAEKEAMSNCAQRGKSCILESAFNKQCGAVAADGRTDGWGVSANMKEAQQKAIEECRKAGGTQCVLHIAFCSF